MAARKNVVMSSQENLLWCCDHQKNDWLAGFWLTTLWDGTSGSAQGIFHIFRFFVQTFATLHVVFKIEKIAGQEGPGMPGTPPPLPEAALICWNTDCN